MPNVSFNTNNLYGILHNRYLITCYCHTNCIYFENFTFLFPNNHVTNIALIDMAKFKIYTTFIYSSNNVGATGAKVLITKIKLN